MKLVQIKTARELKLPGTYVEFVTEGDALKEIILRPEGEPESYSIKPGTSYSDTVRVFIRREFEVKDQWRLTGTLRGLKVQQDFDTEKEAQQALNENQDGMKGGAIKPVQVRVDEAGEPVGPAPGDDIPF